MYLVSNGKSFLPNFIISSEQNEALSKSRFSWGSLLLGFASNLRLASLLGAGVGACALLSALSIGATSGAGTGAFPSVL